MSASSQSTRPPGDVMAGGSSLALQAIWPPLALLVLAALLAVWPDAVFEVSGTDFFIVTALLGGGAAWLSGQAIAETWRPYSLLLLYMMVLAAAVRFIHFALFQGTLLSANHYFVDFVVVAALASLGYRRMRVRQMATQYGWLYARTSPLGWAPKPQDRTSQQQ